MCPGARSAKSAKRVRPGSFWHSVTWVRAEKPDSPKKLCLWTRLVPLASPGRPAGKYLIESFTRILHTRVKDCEGFVKDVSGGWSCQSVSLGGLGLGGNVHRNDLALLDQHHPPRPSSPDNGVRSCRCSSALYKVRPADRLLSRVIGGSGWAVCHAQRSPGRLPAARGCTRVRSGRASSISSPQVRAGRLQEGWSSGSRLVAVGPIRRALGAGP